MSTPGALQARRAVLAVATFILVVAIASGPPYDLAGLAVYGAAFGLPAMIGHKAETPRAFKLWFFALLLYAATLVWAFARSAPGTADPATEVTRIVALLLAVLVCHGARYGYGPASGWWWGVVAAPFAAAVPLIASARLTAESLFLVLAFGAVALAGIPHFRSYARPWVMVPIAALISASFMVWSNGTSWWQELPGSDAEYSRAWRRGGVLAELALLLLFVVPLLRFGRDLTHRAGTLRTLACAGLIVVFVFGGAAMIAPAFSGWKLLVPYVGLVALLHGLMENELVAYYGAPVKRTLSLSAIVICKNEADRIAACLESLAGWVDELIVLDSGSTDGTLEIARRCTPLVFETDWPGYGPQKQRALEKATCDWVLSVDADEVVTRELKHDIDLALAAVPAQVGFHIPWATINYGTQLDFGNTARAPLRLFRRAGTRFSDDLVHERIVLPPGPTGRLRGRLLHYSLRDYGHWLRKSAEYTWLVAQERNRKGKRGGGPLIGTARALISFLKVYVARLGFLDGAVGYMNALNAAQYTFNKYMGLWTLRRSQRRDIKSSRGTWRG